MKKRSAKVPDPIDSNAPAKRYVRYLGFESIDSGRRLRFRVKSNRDEAVDVTLDIADAVFISTPGISIQDAAPMAYEKIVDLLVTQDRVDSNPLSLADADVAQYLTRHVSPQKSTFSILDRRRSDIAA